VAANALTRAMNSAGVFASRRWTSVRSNPPSTKCTWESMNPGTSMAPCASTTRVAGVTSFCTSALEPTAASRPARTATALAHGRAGSPVHTWALTIASETGSEGGGTGGWFTREPRVRSVASVAAAVMYVMCQSGRGRRWRPECAGFVRSNAWWQGERCGQIPGGRARGAVSQHGDPMADGGPMDAPFSNGAYCPRRRGLA
jgi:hypothetical protein